MKIKIPKIFDEYYEEFRKYLKIGKRKFNKIYRTCRYYWNNPKTKIGKIVIPYVKLIYKKIENIINKMVNIIYPYYENFKTKLLKSENRKRNITIIGVFLFINILLVSLLPSFAVFQNQYNFSVLGGIVGDKSANDHDYSLLIFVEKVSDTGEGSGKYNLTSDIPTLGYVYSRYECKNNSILTYDEETKNASVTLEQKETCSIYFDIDNKSDLLVNIMLEEEIDSNTYKIANNIPYYGYKYSHYECDNNSELTYDSNLHKIKIEANNKDYCNIYFKKEPVDLDVKLYVQNSFGKYNESTSIPADNTYKLNEDLSKCTNENNNEIDTNISYVDGYIEININEKAYCEIYLEIENE